MPKVDIDYSKSIIYKLCSNNPEIKEVYIGSTTNFTQRKNRHKVSCNSENCVKFNYPVYKYIRDNGGWDTWSMIMIKEYPCENKLKLLKKERKYIEKYGGSLNRQIPSRTKKEYAEDNKDHLRQYHSDYYEDNKDHILHNRQLYCEKNKEKIKNCLKSTLLKYKEKYKARKQIKCICECGKTYTKQCEARHRRSMKHLNFINNNK